jgi:hypothetical protein
MGPKLLLATTLLLVVVSAVVVHAAPYTGGGSVFTPVTVGSGFDSVAVTQTTFESGSAMMIDLRGLAASPTAAADIPISVSKSQFNGNSALWIYGVYSGQKTFTVTLTDIILEGTTLYLANISVSSRISIVIQNLQTNRNSGPTAPTRLQTGVPIIDTGTTLVAPVVVTSLVLNTASRLVFSGGVIGSSPTSGTSLSVYFWAAQLNSNANITFDTVTLFAVSSMNNAYNIMFDDGLSVNGGSSVTVNGCTASIDSQETTNTGFVFIPAGLHVGMSTFALMSNVVTLPEGRPGSNGTISISTVNVATGNFIINNNTLNIGGTGSRAVSIGDPMFTDTSRFNFTGNKINFVDLCAQCSQLFIGPSGPQFSNSLVDIRNNNFLGTSKYGIEIPGTTFSLFGDDTLVRLSNNLFTSQTAIRWPASLVGSPLKVVLRCNLWNSQEMTYDAQSAMYSGLMSWPMGTVEYDPCLQCTRFLDCFWPNTLSTLPGGEPPASCQCECISQAWSSASKCELSQDFTPTPTPTQKPPAPPPRDTCKPGPVPCGSLIQQAMVNGRELQFSESGDCTLPSVNYADIASGEHASLYVTFYTSGALNQSSFGAVDLPTGVESVSWASQNSFMIVYSSANLLPRRTYSVTVSLRPEGFLPCPSAAAVSLRITGLASPINVGLVQAVSGMSTASAIIASAAGSPTMALQQNKMAVVGFGADCGTDPMDEEPLSAADSPTGMGFGDVSGYYVRGAIVGNLLLFFGINGIFGMLFGALMYARWDQTKTPMNAVLPKDLAWRCLADLHFPSILVVPVGVCYQSTIRASFAMFYYAEDGGDQFLGAFGFIVTMAFTAVVFYVCVFRFRGTLIQRPSEEEEGDEPPHPVTNCLHWWMDQDVKWVGPTDDDTWKHKYLFFFADYKRGFFFAIELGMAAILGILDAIGPTTESGCSAKGAIIFLLIVGFAAVFAWLRPFTSRLAVHYALMMNFVTVISAILALANSVSYSEGNEAAASVFGMIALILGMGKLALDMTLGAMAVYSHRHSILRKIGGAEKGERWGKSLDSTVGAFTGRLTRYLRLHDDNVANKNRYRAASVRGRSSTHASPNESGMGGAVANPLDESLLAGHTIPEPASPIVPKAAPLMIARFTMTDPVYIEPMLTSGDDPATTAVTQSPATATDVTQHQKRPSSPPGLSTTNTDDAAVGLGVVVGGSPRVMSPDEEDALLGGPSMMAAAHQPAPGIHHFHDI